MSLVNIYAWSIDFFRIQKGDAFSVIYEEEYVDDTTYVGLKRVLGANLIHSGNDYYSFQYENELGFDDYYDEEGRSLRKTFLRAPLNFTRISSRYSGRRFHPVQKRWKAHLGTDYAAPTGTPIMTTADGEISAASYTSGNGNYVKVRHNSTYSTQYLHMSKIKPGIKPGVRVKQGDVIGYVGSTGLATGPHVCYRFWVNGKQVDPYKQKLPEAKSLDSTRLAAFKEYSEKLIQELGNN
jgi:murein DD-endopeptidase MepM/ murein hydrolase activator NlpD